MKVTTGLVLFCIVSAAASAQNKTYQIKADSVRIFSNCDTAELILQNRTRGILNGVLTNKGNGVTEFRRILTKINDNTYLVGGDSLQIGAGGSAGNTAWQLNGNNVGQLKTLGTLDNVDLPLITNNTEKMRVMANGNVGIGTQSPLTKLHITNASGALLFNPNLSRPTDIIKMGGYLNTTDGQNSIISASSDGGGNFRNLMVERDGFIGFGQSNNPLAGWWVGNPALRIYGDGRVGVASNYFHFGSFGGPYNSSTLITYVSNVNEWVEGVGQTKGANYYYFGTSLLTPDAGSVRAPLIVSGRQLRFQTGTQQGYDNMYNQGAEALRIDESGNVGIGTVSPNEKLEVAGNIKTGGFVMAAGSAAGYVLTSNAAGIASWQSPGTPSDFNLKENIAFSQFNTTTLLQLPVKDFNYKKDSSKTRYTGLIAQELKTVLPELVLGKEGNYSIDYVKMVPYLLKAIQDQQKEISQLKQQAKAGSNPAITEVLALVQQLQQQVLQQQQEMKLLKEQQGRINKTDNQRP